MVVEAILWRVKAVIIGLQEGKMEFVFRMRGKTGSNGLSDELEHQHRGKVKLRFGDLRVLGDKISFSRKGCQQWAPL